MAWHCKSTGGYTTNTPVTRYPDADGEDNCIEIRNTLMGRGWTLNAVCGLLACAAFESGYNPWRWEGDNVQSTTSVDSFSGGYGLLQWTPASDTNIDRPGRNKYINNTHSVNLPGYGPNFSNQTGNILDGRAQMVYLDTYGYVGSYFNSGGTYGNMEPTFADYKASTRPASDLCEVWVTNFERPQNPAGNRAARQALATALYNWLNGEPPAPTFPVWLLLKWREKNMKGRW